MIQKTIIVVWGFENYGKTSTVNAVLDMIVTYYPGAVLNPQLNTPFFGDLYTIVDTGTVRFGIQSHGDIGHVVTKSLDDFATANCDIILCTTRSKGIAHDYMSYMARHHKYRILWLGNWLSQEVNQKTLNEYTATHIFQTIQHIIKDLL